MNKLIFIFCLTACLIFSEEYIDFKKNITSLLSSTDIVRFNDRFLVSTTGGLYSFSDKDNFLSSFINHNDQLRRYNLSVLKIYKDYLWIGNKGRGALQIFNNDFKRHAIIDYVSIGNILDIAFSNKYAFVLANTSDNINEYVIIQYNIEDLDDPYYLSTILNIPYSFNIINDIEVYNETLYVATDNGMFTNDQLDYIYINQNDWMLSNNNSNIDNFLLHNNNMLFTNEDQLRDINGLYSDNSLSSIVNINNIDNESILIYTYEAVYIYNLLNKLITEPICDDTYFDLNVSNTVIYNEMLYSSFFRNGVKVCDGSLIGESEILELIPNTIYKNQYDALALTDDGNLIGVVNHRYALSPVDSDLQQSGFFILDKPLALSEPIIKNYYSYNGYQIIGCPLSKSNYNAEILNYWSGDNKIHSAVSTSNNSVYFSNSGIYPPSWLGHFSNIATTYGFELSDETEYGGVVEIGFNNDLEATIDDVWNRSENHLGGQYGIFDSNSTDGYMITNHIITDTNDNVWVVNPYSEYPNDEYSNWPISIKHNSGNWFNIKNNHQSYIPKEVAIDNNSNLWISYLYSENYSSSGIRMVEFNNITIEEDDRWNNNLLSDELGDLDIYSLAISNLSDGSQVLWVMCSLGIKGFILNQTYISGYIDIEFTAMKDDYYFNNLSFSEGCKIRIDNQNNIWVTTVDDGLRVINSDGTLLLGEDGNITVDNYNILSNIVHDVIFDDYGNVYIATDYGISILETSFVKNISSKNISVSPNPFIIGEDLQIIISNVASNSTIKIMNLSGYVVKEFNLSNYQKNIPWDGRDENGNKIGSGVYLVTAYSSAGGIGSTKIAIINK